MSRKRYPLSVYVFVISPFLCLLVIIVQHLINQVQPPINQVWIIGTVENSDVLEEKIVLPVNSDREIVTTHRYSGTVTITIQGEGRINDQIHHDAFYVYSDNEQEPVRFDGLEVDGQETLFSVFTGVPPRYNSQHEYSFLYDVGDELSFIGFRISNENEQDDSSEFTIEVSVLNKVTSPGR